MSAYVAVGYDFSPLHSLPFNTWCYHIRVPLTVDDWVLINPINVTDWLCLSLPRKTLHSVVFQKEEGVGGVKHWQMCLFLREKINLRELRLILGLPNNNKGVERMYCKFAENPIATLQYCQKVATRLDGPFWWLFESNNFTS